jgi:hypothetical protein
LFSLQEMHEFNMDDSSRVGWDPMLKSAWLLASGKDVAHTAEQLVVYLRRCVSGTAWGDSNSGWAAAGRVG